MPLNSDNKLQLLKDLLQNQASEQYMTTGEAAQIEQLVSSLSIDASLNPTLHQTLQHIQQTHQLNNEPFQQVDVEQWINDLSVE